MEWQFCNTCSKVVDEYEEKCYWCGSPKQNVETESEYKKDDNQLLLDFGDQHELFKYYN